MKKVTLLLGSALALVPAAAFAAEGETEASDSNGQTITVTGTRTPTPVDQVPATVTVIDEQRIADELASDVRDLVRFEPGVTVPRQPARFGAALATTGRDQNSGFRIRGIGGNRVQILVDGIRVPDGFTFGAQAAGRGDYVDLGIVRSVEILRGPGSALFGSDGLAGVVSFQTSDPADLLAGGRDVTAMLRAQYDSSSDEFSETGLVAGRSGAWSGLISYTRRDGHELENQSTLDFPDSRRTTPNPQDTRSNAVLARIVFAPNDNHRFRMTGDWGDSRTLTDVISGRTAPPASGPLAATAVLGLTARDTLDRRRVSFDWRYNGDGLVEAAQVSAYWQDSENYQFAAEDRNTAADRTRINTFDNRVIGAAAELRLGFDTGAVRHALVLAGDYSVTHQEGLRGGTVPPAGETYPTRAFPETDFTLAGLVITDEISVFDGVLTLFPALRFDSYSLNPEDDPLLPTFQGSSQSDSRVTPRLGAVVRLGGGFSLYGNYASGFKAPAPSQVNNFFENLATPGFAYRSIPNPDLGPETSEAFEGGIRWSGGWANASLSAFTGTYDDFIGQAQTGGTGSFADPIIFQYVNLDGVEISGIEGRAGFAAPNGITFDIAFAYAEGDSAGPNNTRLPLSSIDPVRVVGGLGYRDPGGRFGAQFYVTHSARKALSDTTGVCTAECFRPSAATVLDLTGWVRLGEHFTLRAGLFNLTDLKYTFWGDIAGVLATSATRDAYTQPGRNARVSLTARF